MQKFVIGILIGVLKDPKVQEFLIQAGKRILDDVFAEKILSYLPAMFAGMLDTAIKQIPDVGNIKDVGQVVNTGRDILNKVIPDIDIGYKPLDDLIDAWRPK